MPGGRARQARLGLVDAFDLDRQRQLIIVRRDNTEHLIMIGGPNDIVIESEIVRAEVRDLRDQRRDPGFDSRIPAPAPEKPALTLPGTDKAQLQRPLEEPRLSMPPASLDSRLDGASELPRAPTFPLPPRRPQPAAPERRTTAPPKLPESVSRGEQVPAFSGQPPATAPAPPAPSAPTPPRPTAAPASPAAAVPSATPPAAPGSPPRPPFLKPLSSRPAGKPLPRTTPQAATPGAPPPAVGANATAPARTPESNDALESLEEEMAKLLGRGS